MADEDDALRDVNDVVDAAPNIDQGDQESYAEKVLRYSWKVLD